MATPPSEPANLPPTSPWAPIIFGSLFALASALIFTGVLYHAPAPDEPASPADGATPATNAASAWR